MAPLSRSDPGIYAIAFSSFFHPPPPPSCKMHSQERVFASVHGLTPRPMRQLVSVAGAHPAHTGVTNGSLRLHSAPVSMPQGCGGTGGPCSLASCPGSTKERDGCSCWLFINVLKLPRLAKRPGDTAKPLTTACKGPCSFLGSYCFADGCAQAATGRVSSWALSLCTCCVSRSVPLGAAGASRSGSAV